MFPSIRRNIFC